jgi:hypothetical protein
MVTAPPFRRTGEADRQKKFNDFKRRATHKLRCSAMKHRSAQAAAASMQRARFAGGEKPVSGQAMR